MPPKTSKPLPKPSAKSKIPVKPVKKAAVKPSANKAETILKQEIAKGNTKNFNKTREAIAKKTGTWPNGYTN